MQVLQALKCWLYLLRIHMGRLFLVWANLKMTSMRVTNLSYVPKINLPISYLSFSNSSHKKYEAVDKCREYIFILPSTSLHS